MVREGWANRCQNHKARLLRLNECEDGEASALLNDDDEVLSVIMWYFDGSWVVTDVDADEEELSVAEEDGYQPATFELGGLG